MKPLKSAVIAAWFSVGAVTLASAANTPEYLYVVGAPAYRTESIKNIDTYVKTFTGAGETAAYIASGTDYTTASAVQWLIPNFSPGFDLIINASFTGSTAGVESVAAGNITQKFIADGTGSVASPNNTLAKSAISVAYQPDLTLSDTFQATTVWNGSFSFPTTSPTTISPVYTFQDLSSNAVQLGVEPYVWVASPGFTTATGISNITTSEAQLLYKYGRLPLAYFTGKSTDETTYVYGLSRDPGSGSRLIALAEIGLGPKATIKTYQPTVTGGSTDGNGNYVGGSITDAAYNPNTKTGGPALYTVEQIPSTGVYDNNAGDTGYASFGTNASGTGLLQAITATPKYTSYYITYLDLSDAAEAEAAGATALTYNGLTYSANGVDEGEYSYWSYEILFPSPALANALAGNTTTDQGNFVNGLINQWVATVPLSGLNVSRTVDGGQITHNYR